MLSNHEHQLEPVKTPSNIEMEQRWKAVDLLKKTEIPVVALPKANLNVCNRRPPISYRPNDEVEIKREDDGWYLRNKTLAEEEPAPILAGSLQEVKDEDWVKFRLHWRKIFPDGEHHVQNFFDARQGNPKMKAVQFVEPDGQINGWAYYRDDGNGSIFLIWLQTAPQAENRGVGGAIIEGLKDRVSSINLQAHSKRLDTSKDDSQARLLNFYKSHGLHKGERWNKPGSKFNTLDDKYRSGNWQKVSQLISADCVYISDSDIERIVILRYLSDNNLFTSLPRDTQTELIKWEKAFNKLKARDLENDPDSHYDPTKTKST